MASSTNSIDGDADVLLALPEEVIDDHEERITANERFRLRVEGALTALSIVVGSGGVLTLSLRLGGVI